MNICAIQTCFGWIGKAVHDGLQWPLFRLNWELLIGVVAAEFFYLFWLDWRKLN
jgi:hypothetical protein